MNIQLMYYHYIIHNVFKLIYVCSYICYVHIHTNNIHIQLLIWSNRGFLGDGYMYVWSLELWWVVILLASLWFRFYKTILSIAITICTIYQTIIFLATKDPFRIERNRISIALTMFLLGMYVCIISYSIQYTSWDLFSRYLVLCMYVCMHVWMICAENCLLFGFKCEFSWYIFVYFCLCFFVDLHRQKQLGKMNGEQLLHGVKNKYEYIFKIKY